MSEAADGVSGCLYRWQRDAFVTGAEWMRENFNATGGPPEVRVMEAAVVAYPDPVEEDLAILRRKYGEMRVAEIVRKQYL